MVHASEAAASEPSLNPNSKQYLDALRHSCAHVMAQAVQELFPGTKITIGPAIENGFYYDFDSKHRFAEEDLQKIEKRMQEIVRGDHPFIRTELSKGESRKYWLSREEPYKVEILEGLPYETVSHYTHDTFTDLCRGGHCESTRAIRHFKLLSVAGAYWRGDEKNPMLQRIYGTAWPTQEQLEDYLKQLEEAKQRDHRKLASELDLYSVHEWVGAGLIHWHPKGAVIRFQIESYLRTLLEEEGYQFVYTPHLASEEIYQVSGHLENYAELMYAPMDIEGHPFRAKPMNCPNHIMIFKSRLHSYRELPIKLAEFGTVYRFERSGVLHGLLRVRGFTQDDAHIFCRMDQVGSEVGKLLHLAKRVYQDFGFTDLKSFLSTKPAESSGEGPLWAEAEKMLKVALEDQGLAYDIDAGGGAFYGPKIDLKVQDAIGRPWQLATIQLDFTLPRRFKVMMRTTDGGEDYVVMIHRAILGSFERFLGVLIEHYAGKFPLWLAPVQVKILTITHEQEAWARELEQRLKAAGLRAELDIHNEKIGHKVREATLQKIPYQVILGPRDAKSRTLSVRLLNGKQLPSLSADDFCAKLSEEVRAKRLDSIFS